MEKVLKACADRPAAALMACLALVLAGLWSLRSLPLRPLPPLGACRVYAEVAYPGLPAADLRGLVARPLEDAFASLRGLRRLETLCRDGVVDLVLDFQWGTAPGEAASRAREAADGAYRLLPEGCRRPTVLAAGDGEGPLLVVAVEAFSGDPVLSRRLAGADLASRLRRAEGVGRIALSGGAETEVRLIADLDRCAEAGMGAADLASLLSGECAEFGAGTVREGEKELTLTASARPASARDLESLVLAGRRGPLRLSDLARVESGEAERKSVFVRGRGAGESAGPGRGGEAALEVYAKAGADPLRAAAAARDAVAAANRDWAAYARARVADDASRAMASSLLSLALCVALGAAAAALALVLFLGDIGAGLLAAATVPLSALASLACLAAAGRTVNLMSLSGLAVGVGLISDNAVVVLDALSASFPRTLSRPGAAAAAKAADSVAASSLGSTIAVVAVFLPVLLIPGPLGALCSDLAFSLCAAAVAGWALAFFALPALYRGLWRPRPASGPGGFLPSYRASLRRCLRSPLPVLGASAAAAVLGVSFLAFCPAGVLGRDGVREWDLSLDFPAGTDLAALAGEAQGWADALARVPGIAAVFGRAGEEEGDAEARARISHRRERLVLRCVLGDCVDPDSVLAALRAATADIPPGRRARFDTPEDAAARALGFSENVVLAVRGADPADASARGDALLELCRDAGPGEAARREPQSRREELRLLPRREEAAALGVEASAAARNLLAATEGVEASRFEWGGRPVALRVLASKGPPGAGAWASVPVAAGARPVRAGEVLSCESSTREGALCRLDRVDLVYLAAAPGRGGDLLDAARTHGLAASSPSAYAPERADAEARASCAKEALLALLLACLLLYLAMGAQFESFLLPLLFLAAVPLALAGAGPALFLSGSELDAGALAGLAALFGNAVNNGVILHETAETRAPLLGWKRAAYAGASLRARPVLATALSASVALVPTALFSGAAQRSMALAMIFGTLTSTLLTLYVSPALFALVLGAKRGGRR